jgi:hypothetical protein
LAGFQVTTIGRILVTAEVKADQSQMIASVIGRVLNAKVDRDGKEFNYHHDTRTYIQWLCDNAIEECAKKAIAEWVEKSKPKFEQQFLKELNK